MTVEIVPAGRKGGSDNRCHGEIRAGQVWVNGFPSRTGDARCARCEPGGAHAARAPGRSSHRGRERRHLRDLGGVRRGRCGLSVRERRPLAGEAKLAPPSLLSHPSFTVASASMSLRRPVASRESCSRPAPGGLCGRCGLRSAARLAASELAHREPRAHESGRARHDTLPRKPSSSSRSTCPTSRSLARSRSSTCAHSRGGACRAGRADVRARPRSVATRRPPPRRYRAPSQRSTQPAGGRPRDRLAGARSPRRQGDADPRAPTRLKALCSTSTRSGRPHQPCPWHAMPTDTENVLALLRCRIPASNVAVRLSTTRPSRR